MIFRVGAKPLSNRSVHKVHEDCEVGAGNNPENSSVKGISSWCSVLFRRQRHPIVPRSDSHPCWLSLNCSFR
ncbi:MAG: hypothetical protein U1E78_04485 [Gammaproteobacteria bacterium]